MIIKWRSSWLQSIETLCLRFGENLDIYLKTWDKGGRCQQELSLTVRNPFLIVPEARNGQWFTTVHLGWKCRAREHLSFKIGTWIGGEWRGMDHYVRVWIAVWMSLPYLIICLAHTMWTAGHIPAPYSFYVWWIGSLGRVAISFNLSALWRLWSGHTPSRL